jgi:hypothetical protein
MKVKFEVNGEIIEQVLSVTEITKLARRRYIERLNVEREKAKWAAIEAKKRAEREALTMIAKATR